jgi:protein O-GlcNAc transferase
MNVQQATHEALERYQAGDFEQAERLCKEILKDQPGKGDIWYFLGVIYSQQGKHDLVIESIKKSLQFNPNNPDACHLLGMSLQERGRLDEAIEYYRESIRQNPNYAEAYNNLGNVYKEKKRFDDAIASYQKAIALKPDIATSYYNLGVVFDEKKQYDEAIGYYRKALQYDPSNHAFQNMLGMVLYKKGQLDGGTEFIAESEKVFRKILQMYPDDYNSYCSLANVLKSRGQTTEAIAGYRKAVELNPNFTEAYYNLAVILQETGHIDEAIRYYQKSIELDPSYSETYNNLGVLFQEKSRFDDALAGFQKALELDSNSIRALNNLANIYTEMGQTDKAEGYFRRLLQIDPHLYFIHSNLLLAMNYNPRHDMDGLFSEHLRFAERLAEQFSPIGFYENERSVHRRLKIGYVSPDFRRHSVAYFIEPVIKAHDREQIEVFCYSDVDRKDDVTERIKKLSDQWRDIWGLENEKVSKLVSEDRIDILVDLAGHSGKNRLLMFARKPAPVQVSWIGYPATTGLSAIDYKIVDGHTDPPGMTERYYSEKLVRLPDSFLCYMPEKDAPEVNGLPVAGNGYVTFGSFNNFAKVSHETLLLWAEILGKLPSSRLIMKAKGLSNTTVRNTVVDFFQRHGIAAERIELFSLLPSISDHFALYNRIDIALDTFPYNGTTTTCEALWMGVPVVSLAGKTYASRVGASLLSNIGLSDLVAEEPAEYERNAVTLAGDLTRLSSLREHLRGRMAQSALTDARRFTDNLEKAFRQMWIQWCSSRGV